MFTIVPAGTAFVPTAKVAVVAPAATVTVAGTVAAFALLLASVTTRPPAGAAALSVTVPVVAAPPTTDAGLTATVLSATAGFTVRVAVFATPPYVAVIVAAVAAVTENVEIAKVAFVCPAGTTTVPGTNVAVLFVFSDTVAPPAPAAEDRVTVPVALAPAGAAVGAMLTAPKTPGAGAAIFTRKPSFPPAFCGCSAAATGRFVEAV